MLAELFLAVGGIGLFLLGMLVLTEGLRALAGSTLRRTLTRLTRSPVSGAAAGALTTAVIQSSSATTVTAVGFVGAGLLTFPQALGVIFGANIGTTITGWLVALVGFKLELGLIAPPLLLAGALLRLFTTGKPAQIGWALAGFSLLFLGIDAMKAGMTAFEGTVTPDIFPDDTIFGRFQLVLIGMLITLVTQSSSAGVATALVALSAGSISLPQAAAMVIGMDVGTTATALLAALGGSTAMRRTGFAHVTYNVLAGTLAFLLLTPFAAIAGSIGTGTGEPQLALVAFHTAFNLLGVCLILPFAGRFAAMIERLVPEREAPFLRHLETKLLSDPSAAIDAASAAVRELSLTAFGIVAGLLSPQERSAAGRRLAALSSGVEAVRSYLERAPASPKDTFDHRRHASVLHALDHLLRLAYRCARTDRIEALDQEHRLRRLARVLQGATAEAARQEQAGASEAKFDRIQRLLQSQQTGYRARTVETAAIRHIDAETTLGRLDGVRWLYRVSYHLWRIAHHAGRSAEAEPTPAAELEEELTPDAE